MTDEVISCRRRPRLLGNLAGRTGMTRCRQSRHLYPGWGPSWCMLRSGRSASSFSGCCWGWDRCRHTGSWLPRYWRGYDSRRSLWCSTKGRCSTNLGITAGPPGSHTLWTLGASGGTLAGSSELRGTSILRCIRIESEIAGGGGCRNRGCEGEVVRQYDDDAEEGDHGDNAFLWTNKKRRKLIQKNSNETSESIRTPMRV